MKLLQHGITNADGGIASSVRVRVRTFRIPIIRDGVVIGRDAPVNGAAMAATLRLMTPEPFAAIALRDDTIRSLLVREAVLRKIGLALIIRIVRREIKPLMVKSEILALRLEIEMVLGENFIGKQP